MKKRQVTGRRGAPSHLSFCGLHRQQATESTMQCVQPTEREREPSGKEGVMRFQHIRISWRHHWNGVLKKLPLKRGRSLFSVWQTTHPPLGKIQGNQLSTYLLNIAHPLDRIRPVKTQFLQLQSPPTALTSHDKRKNQQERGGITVWKGLVWKEFRGCLQSPDGAGHGSMPHTTWIPCFGKCLPDRSE